MVKTISESAVPVPAEWFAGEQDRRWRRPDGHFKLVAGPADEMD